MKRELIDLLACPACRGTLEFLRATGDAGRVEDGELVCSWCQRSFTVEGGIPRMFQESEDSPTAERFAYEWQTFPEISGFYEKQFLDWIHPINEDFFSGKTVLDAGCGKGRHALLASRFGAKTVVGLDLGKAVEVAYCNTKDLSNVHLVQGDVCQPPLRRVFDYIYCIGVLHHLRDPEEGFKSLCQLLEPGGTISIWVYGREGNGWIVHIVNPVREFLTAKMPLGMLKVVSWPIAALLFLMAKLIYRPAQVHWRSLSRILFYNNYVQYIAQFDFREFHAIVFDHLLAPVAFYIRKEEVLSWFEKAKFTDMTIAWHNKNSWRITARKPTSEDSHS